MNYWLDHCEPPRPRPDGVEWDVFVSYRSLDRTWAIALYDMLTQCGYKVFVDQYVLVPGQGLATQLGNNLQRSNGGVLLWSKNTAGSQWVENELNQMVARQAAGADGPNPFHFVVAGLDKTPVQGLAAGKLNLDFSDYPDGPMGADMVRLTVGLQGKPLTPAVVTRVATFERNLKDEPAKLRALARADRFPAILERIQAENEPYRAAYTTSATLLGVAVDTLIRSKQYPLALSALELALTRFPTSLRLRQLQGLALRRSKKLDEACYQLNLLREEGHEDPETMGMLASVYADIWEAKLQSGDAREAKDVLEQSRHLYLQTFKKVPTDTYVGINAAAKSALLGDFPLAQSLATDVLKRVEEARTKRNGAAPTYWDYATEAEAWLLKLDAARALPLYHEARIAYRDEKGSIEATATQVQRLLHVLDVGDAAKKALRDEFGLAS